MTTVSNLPCGVGSGGAELTHSRIRGFAGTVCGLALQPGSGVFAGEIFVGELGCGGVGGEEGGD